jgi:hypothetical protein
LFVVLERSLVVDLMVAEVQGLSQRSGHRLWEPRELGAIEVVKI